MAGSTQSTSGKRTRIALTRVLRLAEAQWGVIARWQLEQCGISTGAIARLAAPRRLHRIYPGVYAVGHRAICTERRLLAAILYAGPGAALSHSSAAHWWELVSYRRLIDLEAIGRGSGVGRSGSAALRRALSLHRPARTLSPAEDLPLDLCRRHRIPFPQVNARIGPYKVDALWREQRLVVEVGGGDGHGTRAQMQRDRERDLALRDAGYSVRRYSGLQMTRRSAAVAADIRRGLKRGVAPTSEDAR